LLDFGGETKASRKFIAETQSRLVLNIFTRSLAEHAAAVQKFQEEKAWD